MQRKLYFCLNFNTWFMQLSRGVILQSRDDYSKQLDTRKQQIMTWATAEKTKVDRGTLKNSEYWTLFSKELLSLDPTWTISSILQMK